MDSKSDTYYNMIAQGYNTLHGEEQMEKVEIVQKFIRNDKTLSLKLDLILFDVGCGSGISTSVLATNRAGLDPALELLRQANDQRMNIEKNANQKQNGGIDRKFNFSNHFGYIQGIAEALPIKNKSCNIVISITAAHKFDDIELSIREIKRITIDRAIITILKRSKKFNIILKTIKNKFQILNSAENRFDYLLYLKPSKP